MSSILERNKDVKIPKKTLQEHAEDALYREVWEEVHAQKTYDFVKKYAKWLIAMAILILASVIVWQVVRHQGIRNQKRVADMYESANVMMNAGKFDLASESFSRLAKSASGGMYDIAIMQSARADMMRGARDAAIMKLEKLVKDGKTRDYRDLAVINLAMIKGDSMTPGEFEKFLSPLQTKRSPYYYAGLMLVAQKYLSAGDTSGARVWLDKIITDKDAPASIDAIAESLR